MAKFTYIDHEPDFELLFLLHPPPPHQNKTSTKILQILKFKCKLWKTLQIAQSEIN